MTQFVIWAYPYDEEKGGHIVLLALNERLNELGYSAAIWPWQRPVSLSPRRWAAYVLKPQYRFETGPFSPRFARRSDLDGAVIVYPEVVSGNPLKGRRVARWLLHRPGYHSGKVDFGEDDLIFCYNQAFGEGQLLTVTYHLPQYRQWNFGPREGACVLVRKGADRKLDQHPAEAIVIDDLSHEEKAELFNRCRFLYSYDPYSYFSVYAAICGCIPIIVPQHGVSEEEWQPDRRWRVGMAYGEDRIEWATATRGELLQNLEERRALEDDMVRSFAERCLKSLAPVPTR